MTLDQQVELKRARTRWDSTTIPNLVGNVTPYLAIDVMPGRMPRSLHAGVATIKGLSNRGFGFSVVLRRQGSRVGELPFYFGGSDLFSGLDYDTAPPCTVLVNAAADGAPGDIQGISGAGVTAGPNALVWNLDNATGINGQAITHPIQFIADCDKVELVMRDAGYWDAGGFLADSQYDGAGTTANTYFLLAMISNRF